VKYVLYFYVSTFRIVCAVPNMAVFCISLISCFPGRLLRYCLILKWFRPLLLLLLLLVVVVVVVVVVVAVVWGVGVP